MVETFVTQWDAQRRPLADWLGRPEAGWDPSWGFLGWRTDKDSRNDRIGEKKPGSVSEVECNSSQESDDVSAWPKAGSGWVAHRKRPGPGSDLLLTEAEKNKPTALTSDVPPALAGAPGVRGREFKGKVRQLLEQGITEPSTRHDAVLTLVFYWGATCGLGEAGTLARLEAWCAAHAHLGSHLSQHPKRFRKTCMQEGLHYYVHHSARW
jgi:hypothetical protein